MNILSMRPLHYIVLISGLVMLASCGGNKKETPTQQPAATDYGTVKIPQFDADSAYRFVSEQLAFGFRIPGTKEHAACAAYLEQQMGRWCDTVMVQEFSTTLWNQQSVRGKNIIASINPAANKRILLAAHWDSRMWADHDSNADNHKKPIMGANDGASGVAVLMEMARVMKSMALEVGVDFIFYDVEDQGIPEWTEQYEDNSWCKGSQYWSQNPHVPYYSAIYGILFDMVGGINPRFTKEEISRRYAPGIMNKVWDAANSMGYSNIFVNEDTEPILDDHLYVNQIIGIPMIDIVQNSPGMSFFDHWHTVNDNIDCIDKQTLKIVGDVALKTIYADYAK